MGGPHFIEFSNNTDLISSFNHQNFCHLLLYKTYGKIVLNSAEKHIIDLEISAQNQELDRFSVYT